MYFRFTPKSVVERVASKLARDEVNDCMKKGLRDARQHGRRKMADNSFPVQASFVYCNTFSLPTVHMNIQWDMQGSKWSLSTGVDSGTFTCIEGRARRHTVGIGSCGGWEGGALMPLWDVIGQMHTIGRMVVIYTTPGIVGYLLLWNYSCFISGTENNSNLSYKQRKKMIRSTIFKHFNNNSNNNNNNNANIYSG